MTLLFNFTFVSAANAFVLRGATPVFVDIRPDTMNIDEQLIEAAVTDVDGLSDLGSFTVDVTDTVPPVLESCEDQVVECADSDGVTVEIADHGIRSGEVRAQTTARAHSSAIGAKPARGRSVRVMRGPTVGAAGCRARRAQPAARCRARPRASARAMATTRREPGRRFQDGNPCLSAACKATAP